MRRLSLIWTSVWTFRIRSHRRRQALTRGRIDCATDPDAGGENYLRKRRPQENRCPDRREGLTAARAATRDRASELSRAALKEGALAADDHSLAHLCRPLHRYDQNRWRVQFTSDLITFAGVPAAIEPEGISRVTSARAPMTLSCPIVTPFAIIAP